MPKIVPVKKIDPVLVDIKRPGGGEYRPRPHQLNLVGISAKPVVIYRRPKFRFVFLTPVLILIMGGGIFLVLTNYNSIKITLERQIEQVFSNFTASIQSLKEFQPDKASRQLKANDLLLADLTTILNKYGGQKLIEIVGAFLPADFKEASGLLNQTRELNSAVLKTSELLSDLKLNSFSYFQKNGPALVSKLKDLRSLLISIVQKAENIQKSASALKKISPAFGELNNLVAQQYISYNSELYRWENFLNDLIAFLDRSEDVHFLVLFQNPSEIRPAGGFIGSYADIIIRNGQLYFIDVRDIYDPEGQLDLKIIPPEPLQVTTHIWGTRDANWFFDFPTSAAKVIYFLENSKLYREQGITFDAAVAINLDVFKSILEVIGPIALEDGLVLNAENVSRMLRQEIEKAKFEGAAYPKQILRTLTPVVLERLQNLDGNKKEKFIEDILGHIERKDIMFFAKDKSLQNFFVSQNIGGGVYELPYNFFGSYLAVVNANIEGGKSDAFVKQELELDVVLDTNGGSFNNLIIKRTHRGDKEKEPWWRKTNQNYIQIFTNPAASLVSLKGNNKAPARFKEINYEALNYSTDADVKRLEDKRIFLSQYQTWFGEMFGKTVFGTWFNVVAGQSKELEVRYQIQPKINGNIADGKIYQFIYEKQSGVNNKLKVKITAPFGYNWFESQAPTYIYETENPEGRIIINLTLVRN